MPFDGVLFWHFVLRVHYNFHLSSWFQHASTHVDTKFHTGWGEKSVIRALDHFKDGFTAPVDPPRVTVVRDAVFLISWLAFVEGRSPEKPQRLDVMSSLLWGVYLPLQAEVSFTLEYRCRTSWKGERLVFIMYWYSVTPHFSRQPKRQFDNLCIGSKRFQSGYIKIFVIFLLLLYLRIADRKTMYHTKIDQSERCEYRSERQCTTPKLINRNGNVPR